MGAQCDAMLGKAELLADVATIVEVALHLYIFADLFAFQSQGIEAAVTHLPLVESATFKMLDEMGMATSKGHTGRGHEPFLILQ